MIPARLHPDDLDAVIEGTARRVIELLQADTEGDVAEPLSPTAGLLTAEEVARRFGVARGWVYANADALGVVRLGSGSKPRLRFDVAEVAERMRARSAGEESRRRGWPAGAGVRGDAGIERVPIDLEVLPERWRQAVGCEPSTESGAAPRQRPAPGPGGTSSGAARTLPAMSRRASSARSSSPGAPTEGSQHDGDD